MNFVLVEVHIYFTLRTTVFKLGVQASYSFSLFLFCMENTAPELVAALQENYKKVALGLLDKAKNICANYGVGRTPVNFTSLFTFHLFETSKILALFLGSDCCKNSNRDW